MAENVPSSIVCALRYSGSNEIAIVLYPEPETPTEPQTVGPGPEDQELLTRPPDASAIALYVSDVFSIYTPSGPGRWDHRGYFAKVSPTLSEDPAVRSEGYMRLVTAVERLLGKTALKIAII